MGWAYGLEGVQTCDFGESAMAWGWGEQAQSGMSWTAEDGEL